MRRKCPNCGEIVESKFCTSCGQDLTGPKIIRICPNCGTETASKYCTGCGAKLFEEVEQSNAPATDVIVTEGLSASDVIKKAKELGAQKVKDLEHSAEAKRAQREKEAELLRLRQEREANLLREQQEREEEQRRQAVLRAEEEKRRQLEREQKEAQEREEAERKKKLIRQKKTYEEGLTYLDTAAQSDDHSIAAKFYRQAEELFSSIPGVEDAGEKSLFAARKAKEHEVILEAERLRVEQEAKEVAAAAKTEESRLQEQESSFTKSDDNESNVISKEKPTAISLIQDAPDSKPESSKRVSKKNNSKVIIAIVAVIVLAVAGIIFGLTQNGSDDAINSEDLETANTVASEQLPTELFSDDNLVVTADKALYTTGASDIQFEISVKNNTKDAVKIILMDVVIDDVTIPVDYDGSEDSIENGDWEISRDIYLTEITDAGVTEFNNLSCSFVVMLDGKALQKTDITLEREALSDIVIDISGSEVNNSDRTIEISKKNLSPIIVSNEKYSIEVEECNYFEGESIDINLDVKNNSKELMYIYMEDLKIDDCSIKTSRDVDPIQAGEFYSGLYIYSDELQAAGVEDFKEMSFTMVVKVGDKEDLKQKIHITRDGFI